MHGTVEPGSEIPALGALAATAEDRLHEQVRLEILERHFELGLAVAEDAKDGHRTDLARAAECGEVRFVAQLRRGAAIAFLEQPQHAALALPAIDIITSARSGRLLVQLED